MRGKLVFFIKYTSKCVEVSVCVQFCVLSFLLVTVKEEDFSNRQHSICKYSQVLFAGIGNLLTSNLLKFIFGFPLKKTRTAGFLQVKNLMNLSYGSYDS